MADFECKNKAMALTALDTIAGSMTGTQREALLAVKAWVQENTPNGLTDEVRKKLEEAFKVREEGRKGDDWYDHWRKNNGNVPDPEHGVELTCFWNASTRQWEPRPYSVYLQRAFIYDSGS